MLFYVRSETNGSQLNISHGIEYIDIIKQNKVRKIN